jgi:hypothetical protein
MVDVLKMKFNVLEDRKMKSAVKLSMLLIVAGLVSSSLGALGSAIVEFDFMYGPDGSTVVTEGAGIAPGNWTVANNIYDSAGVQNEARVPGYVATYASYDTAGLPAGMDGYALRNGAVYLFDDAVKNTGNGFTTMARVNLKDVSTGWTTIIGRPNDYIIFINPAGNLNLFIQGVGDIWEIKTAAQFGTWTDTWVDLAFTFDGVGDGLNADTYTLYVNGQVAYTDTKVTTVNGTDLEHLGATGGGGQRFFGLIDYYAYYDGAATAAEIQALTVIPEPATLVLLGLGSLTMLRKRK